uniref:Uncharacterized protein n=1 Tax=Trypanosoma vivax (strain Y486) TaxID=1055687 RepID=G0U719_TRYVY|nr:hypothetical protein TVY486_1007220 [Trypanosoma vivax Y486]
MEEEEVLPRTIVRHYGGEEQSEFMQLLCVHTLCHRFCHDIRRPHANRSIYGTNRFCSNFLTMGLPHFPCTFLICIGHVYRKLRFRCLITVFFVFPRPGNNRETEKTSASGNTSLGELILHLPIRFFLVVKSLQQAASIEQWGDNDNRETTLGVHASGGNVPFFPSQFSHIDLVLLFRVFIPLDTTIPFFLPLISSRL